MGAYLFKSYIEGQLHMSGSIHQIGTLKYYYYRYYYYSDI